MKAWAQIKISKIPANVDLDDLTDETGKVVATVNDADKVLTKYGIALVGTDGKMRDLGTIMDEIGAKWSQMSQLEQNQLAYVVLSSHDTKKFVGVIKKHYNVPISVNPKYKSTWEYRDNSL